MGTASLTYEKKYNQPEVSSAPSSHHAPKKVSVGTVEKRRVQQLVICMVLFGIVFIGKGILPRQMAQLTPMISAVLSSDTDFFAVATEFRQSLTEGNGWANSVEVLIDGLLWETQTEVISGEGVGYQTQIDRLLGVDWTGNLVAQQLGITLTTAVDDDILPEVIYEELEVAEEAIITPVAYEGIPLPENVTLDYYNLEALGVGEMVLPTDGVMTSEFGWRIHPIYNEVMFHYGTDMEADTGDPIGAFASGTVDYIGESDDYGLYLQLTHQGGVTSFYAHCSELLVQAGQQVYAGDVVALAGSTGVSTGPHLHFELKVDGTYINSGYYLGQSIYA